MTMAIQAPQKQGKHKASNRGQQKEVAIIMKCCCMLTTLVCLLGVHRVNKKIMKRLVKTLQDMR